MGAPRIAILLSGLALTTLGCTDDLVPITAHWNQAQIVMLKRVAELKASVADLRLSVQANPGMAVNNWQSEEVKTSLRDFEKGVGDLERLFQLNDTAVSEALRTGKLTLAKSAIERAEADFDELSARLYPGPAQIRAALEGTRRR